MKEFDKIRRYRKLSIILGSYKELPSVTTLLAGWPSDVAQCDDYF